MRKLISCFIFSLLLMAGWMALIRSAAADTLITVNTTDDVIADDGFCSLREAVIAANTDSPVGGCPAGSGADTINFSPSLPTPATFTLALTGTGEDAGQTGDLDLEGFLTIEGQGAAATVLDGNGADRIFDVRPAARVTISGVTAFNGNPGFAYDGGGVAIRSTGRLVINNSVILSNTAASGGGIHILGLLGLYNSVVEANAGGGIRSDGGGLILNDVQVVGNRSNPGISNENLSSLQLDGGLIDGNDRSGIRNSNSTAMLANVTVIDNGDGGIRNHSLGGPTQLTVTATEILSNAGTSGAGILNEGIQATATIEDVRISFNVATAGGGGINNNGNLSVRNSAIDHNSARSGGGIDHSGSSLNLANVTISANTVSDNGGGLYNRSSATLTNVTVTGNAAGDGVDTGGNVFNDGDTAQLAVVNSIMANPGPGGNCSNTGGVMSSLGHNLDSENSCDFTGPGDLTDTDPLLGPLQDNGGPTFTHALAPDSPAIDGGDDNSCPAVDQRGISRPQGSACDIGAFEFAAAADLSVGMQRQGSGDILSGEPLTYTITITNSGPTAPVSATVNYEWLPASSVVAVDAPGCEVDVTAGTVSCSVNTLGIGSVSVPSPHLVLTTGLSFSGTLTSSAGVTLRGGVTDPAPDDNTTPPFVIIVTNPRSYGVDLSPDAARSGQAGALLTYSLSITNSGNVEDTFALSAAGNTWTSTVSTPSMALSPGASGRFTVSVSIPADALGNDVDHVTIAATSESDATKSDTAHLTTTVLPVYEVEVLGDDAQVGLPGRSVTFTLSIHNHGNLSDTYGLVVVDNVWETLLSSAHIIVGPGAEKMVTATVTVPGEGLAGDVDAALITARSSGNPAISDSATLTTSVGVVSGVDLSPGVSLLGLAGETVRFTLSITNTGNVSDVFDLEATGNVWPTLLSVDSMPLPAGGKGLVMVTVAVPSSAVYLESDATTVMATSRLDPTKHDMALLTTYSKGLPKRIYFPTILRG